MRPKKEIVIALLISGLSLVICFGSFVWNFQSHDKKKEQSKTRVVNFYNYNYVQLPSNPNVNQSPSLPPSISPGAVDKVGFGIEMDESLINKLNCLDILFIAGIWLSSIFFIEFAKKLSRII